MIDCSEIVILKLADLNEEEFLNILSENSVYFKSNNGVQHVIFTLPNTPLYKMVREGYVYKLESTFEQLQSYETGDEFYFIEKDT